MVPGGTELKPSDLRFGHTPVADQTLSPYVPNYYPPRVVACSVAF